MEKSEVIENGWRGIANLSVGCQLLNVPNQFEPVRYC